MILTLNFKQTLQLTKIYEYNFQAKILKGSVSSSECEIFTRASFSRTRDFPKPRKALDQEYMV